ncbi:MAG: hypothetical protein AAGH68_04630 [Pseudomonadota bacterium]
MDKLVGLLIICLSLSVGLGATKAHADRFDTSLYTQACKHYVNRAKFRARTENPEFVIILADSCLPALRSLRSPHFDERLAAADYLARLVAFRDTVIDMNMERVFGKGYTRWTRMKSVQDDKTTAVPRVSETGEYLIAYRMGLLEAYREWLDTGPRVAFGSAPGVEGQTARP